VANFGEFLELIFQIGDLFAARERAERCHRRPFGSKVGIPASTKGQAASR
jgi:hypothetical protein